MASNQGSVLFFYFKGENIENAEKETLVKENDRDAASPTESAVRGSLQREHSGADYLNCILEPGNDLAGLHNSEYTRVIRGTR